MNTAVVRYEIQELNFDAVPGKSTEQMEREFLAFHKAHPEVYEVLCKLAREQLRRGRKHLGISALYERCRYEFGMGDKATAPHLNNNHRAFYARLMMAQEPDLAGVFELRKQRRDRKEKLQAA
jgi:hypothetical protein